MAVLWTVDRWLTPPVTGLLVANHTNTAFIAYNVVVALSLLVGIATFVLVGRWLGLARRNADRIAPDQQRWSKGWVWLSWIVPIVSLWYPKQVVDDVWRSTVRDPVQPRTEWWWGTFIAAVALTWLSPIVIPSMGWVVSWVLVAGMTTVAAAFWIRVVQTISQAQDTLAGEAAPSASRQVFGHAPGDDFIEPGGYAPPPTQSFTFAGEPAQAADAAVHTPTDTPRLDPIVPRHPPAAETVQGPNPQQATPDGRASAVDRWQRRRWLLLAIATALVIAIAAVAFVFLKPSNVDARPGTGAAQLMLSTSQVAIGDTYPVTAWGFAPGEDVRFSWTGPSNGQMGVFPADPNGITSPGPVLERDPPGHYTITATGLTSELTASAELQVVTGPGTGAAQLMLSTSQVAIGDTYFVTAWGFAPGEDVRFSWTGPSNGQMGVLPADPNGITSPGPVLERDPPGHYTITATGLTSGSTDSAQLEIVPAGN